ncbi:MAG: carboxypeptidase-like regulatory domain-containing protein [Vicinamibacterales bacterium]
MATPVPVRLFVFVLDTGFRPLVGARVEVVDGPEAGRSATTDENGSFSWTGSFDSTTRFRASKEGHVNATQAWKCSVAVCGPGAATPWVGFYLDVLAPPVDIAGHYTLTILADATCADLPDEARSRTYAATVSPNAPSSAAITSYTVTVSDASFPEGFDNFSIGVAGDYLGFSLHGGHDPPIVEQLTANTYFAVSGNAAATIGTSGVSAISAAFDGWIAYCAAPSPMSAFYSCGMSKTQCESSHHRLMMTRR